RPFRGYRFTETVGNGWLVGWARDGSRRIVYYPGRAFARRFRQRHRFLAGFEQIVRHRLGWRRKWRQLTPNCSVPDSPRWRRGQGIPENLVAVAADGQFVAGFEIALQDADAVDADAVGAAQIPHDQVIANLGYAAMPAGNFARNQLDVALLMTAQQQDGL